jgi:toxin ParE1/3/4
VRKPLLRTERADQDLREATLYLLEEAGQDVALRFLSAVDETFALLEEQPGIGRGYVPENPELQDFRSWRVHRFERYLVFYRELEDTVRVERILHGSRNIWSVLGLEE